MLADPKNAIKVGSVQKSTRLRSLFSSMGPTRDGRVGPDVMAPGSGGDYFEKYHVEIDYIRIIGHTGTMKRQWNFSNTLDGWLPGDYNVDTMNRGPGDTTCLINTGGNGFIVTDTLNPNMAMEQDDTIAIRYRADDLNSPPYYWCRGYKRLIDFLIQWQLPADTTRYRAYWWTTGKSLRIYGNINDGWQEIRLSLSRVLQDDNFTSMDTIIWKAGSNIKRMAITFTPNQIMSLSTFYHGYNGYYRYTDMNGTSMACPHVAGISALMLQKYNEEVIIPRNVASGGTRTIHANHLWNSSARAILIHTAEDLIDTVGLVEGSNLDFDTAGFQNQPTIYGVGPDWATGYGLANAPKALEYTDTTRFLEDTIRAAGERHYFLYCPPNTDKFRVTMAWDDPGHGGMNDIASSHDVKLVNDVDLYVIDHTNGTANDTTRPWFLDHRLLNDGTYPPNGYDTLITPAVIRANPARRARDSLNNVEVVDIDNPGAGLWEAVVRGTDINLNQSAAWPGAGAFMQDFSLVHDFPLIRDTAATHWSVNGNGSGDFRNIEDAINFAGAGDTVIVATGIYQIVNDIDTTNIPDNIVLRLPPGTRITFAPGVSGIYVGSTGRIIGADFITITPAIQLYNTPVARSPEANDALIGSFSSLCEALEYGKPGQTTVAGPGEYYVENPGMLRIMNEGLIGTLNPTDSTKQSIVWLGYTGGPACLHSTPPPGGSTQRTLMKDLIYRINDAQFPAGIVMGICDNCGDRETEINNCDFENMNIIGGLRHAIPLHVGFATDPFTGVFTLRNCRFSHFAAAVNVVTPHTIAASPNISNNTFTDNNVDIIFQTGSNAYCGVRNNSINTMRVGTTTYTGAAQIRNAQAAINCP
jgi:hypothetical protein